MGNCCCCKKCIEKEKENEINSDNGQLSDQRLKAIYNTNITYSSTNIELVVTDGTLFFTWTFYNYQYISEIVDRIKREANIGGEIFLVANTKPLEMNEKIGDKLKNGDTVIYNNKFKGGKYFN